MRNFIILLCLSFATAVYSQTNQAEFDSLRQIIAQSKQDTNKVNSLLELSRRISQKDFVESKDLADEAIALSESLKWAKGVALGYKHRGFVYSNNTKYDEAMTAFQTSKTKYEAINDKKGIASLLNEIGAIHFYQNNLEQSLEHFSQAADLEFELGNLERSCGSLLNIANIHKATSNLPLSLEFFERALDLQTSLKSTEMETTIMVNIGALYSSLNDKNKAIQILERALKTAKSSGLLDLEGNIYANLSSSYSKLPNTEKALDYANKALAIFQELNYHRGMPIVLSLIGTIQHEKKEYSKALANYEEARVLLIEHGNKKDLGELITNLSSLLYDMGDYQNALSNAKEGLKLSQETQNLICEQSALFSLQKCYAKLGNTDAAYQNLRFFVDVKDSLFNEEKIREISQIEMQYAINREKLADSLVFNQKEIVLESQVQQAKQDKMFSFGIAGLLALLAIILYRNNQRKRQTNELLSQQK
jgi:tetratricopeptide (TPR) repeat protein